MAALKFISADGTETEVQVDPGDELSIMQAAVNNGVRGIDAECGGALSCATCHVHFSREWHDRLTEAGAMEKDMLEFVVEPKDTSRLSCQIPVTEELDGIEIHIPESQY